MSDIYKPSPETIEAAKFLTGKALSEKMKADRKKYNMDGWVLPMTEGLKIVAELSAKIEKLRAFVEEVANARIKNEDFADMYTPDVVNKARKLLDSLDESSGDRRIEKEIDGQESTDGKEG